MSKIIDNAKKYSPYIGGAIGGVGAFLGTLKITGDPQAAFAAGAAAGSAIYSKSKPIIEGVCNAGNFLENKFNRQKVKQEISPKRGLKENQKNKERTKAVEREKALAAVRQRNAELKRQRDIQERINKRAEKNRNRTKDKDKSKEFIKNKDRDKDRK